MAFNKRISSRILKTLQLNVMKPASIFVSADFIVINKPAGLPVHGGGAVRGETLVDWLLEKYPEIKNVGDDPKIRPGIVHRLDKETSGVMIVAKNKESFGALKKLFQTRQITKKYLALVRGRIEKKYDTIVLPIGVLKKHGVKRTVRLEAGKAMKEAVTEFRVLEKFKDASLLEVMPKTGRMHQIRVHLASIGHPVLGDKLYGGKLSVEPGLNRQFLHAASLSFSYPPGQRFTFETSLPQDLKGLVAALRKNK